MSSSYQVNLGSGDDPIQSYIERIKDDYEKELTLISELDHDVSQIGHDESKINAKTKQIDQYWIWTTNGGEYVTTYHWTNKYSQSQINQWQSQVNHLNSDVHNCTQKLEQLDIGLKGLDDTLEGLLRGLESTLSQDTIGNNIGEDVQKILGYVHELCNAMRQEAKANECEKICQETLDHGGNLNDVQKWAAAMREARFEEGSTLNALASTIADDLSFFHQQNDNATVDKNNFF
ncbi:MAG: hypothetical protein FJZ64_01605, partial [Chlamydiae bacterium]|nr:hypothetical protein [Chlamydiota bacterium]